MIRDTLLSEAPVDRIRRETLLAPVAYSESVLPALRLARSSRLARRIAVVLLVGLASCSVVVLCAPWQQSVAGSGNVIAYAPRERQQYIEAPIKGRIVRWGEGIFENARVRKGQPIAEIQDQDPNLMSRLESELVAYERAVAAAQQQVQAGERNQEATRTAISSYESQLAAYTSVREQTVAAADAYVEMARQKLEAEEESLEEQKAAFAQVEADYARQKTLYDEKIASQLKFQEAERKYKEALAKVAKAEAYVNAAEEELSGKQSEREAKERKAQVDIDYATAMLRKATGEVAKSESDLAKSQSELNKAEIDLLEMQVKVSRQKTQLVTAPLDGIIVQIEANLGSKVLKEGDPLCLIVPDTQERAAQVWLRGNDAPLVEPGRHVRLQFEGWPAVQFAGWPAVAVGTFGGRVVSVDATDDGKGRFRVLVLPDPEDRPWPSERFLRQGVRANGWVLLNRVPLWFEVWRNLNGFPPTTSIAEPKDKDAKPPKLAKP